MSNQTHTFRLRPVFVVLSGLLYTNVTSADSLDTWNVSYARSMTHHRNVIDLAKGNGSDIVTVDTLGLKINKPYSLQRFELDMGLSKSRNQKFDNRNFDANNYAAAWRWNLTPSLRGNLISSHDKGRGDISYNEFDSFQNRIPITTENVRTDTMQRFDADYDVGGGWHALGGAFSRKVTNTAAIREERDNTLKSSELGGRYDFTSGSSIGFINRSGRGTYDKSGDEGFDQTENMLTFSWPVTAKTRLDTRVGRSARDNDNAALVDYSGTVGSLKLSWDISGKSRLSAGLTRSLSGNDSFSYSTVNRFFFSPVWQISSRTALRFRYDFIKQDYLDAVAPSPDGGRRDIKRIGLLAIDWQPMSAVSVSVSMTDDRRTSNQEVWKFKDTRAQVSVQVGF
jgi:exopolysaccharide biosynthesis operon protein EpsL